jgi:hypothetical protein
MRVTIRDWKGGIGAHIKSVCFDSLNFHDNEAETGRDEEDNSTKANFDL